MLQRLVPLIFVFLGSVPLWAQDGDALFEAARASDLKRIQTLLEAGVPIDSRDKYGTTALSIAVGNGRRDIAGFLLEKGADPNLGNEFYGYFPLDLALYQENPEMAMLLLKHGARNHDRALEFAVRLKSSALARAAIEKGPILESVLARLRGMGEELDPEIRALLEKAQSRPDPEIQYSQSELQQFAGSFEGFETETKATTSIRDGSLFLAVDGGEAREMTVVEERVFRAKDESANLRISFNGRAGTIEGFALFRNEDPPELLRHSVADPVAEKAPAPVPEPTASGKATVHWPGFRGENASGIGDGVDVPVTWNLESGESILWKTEIPGLGNSSPVVWGDRIFLTTAIAEGIEQEIRTGLTGATESISEEKQHSWRVYAFDKASGRELWQTEVGTGIPLTKRHFKATQANSTPVTDGRHLVVVFPTAGIACLDPDGNILWKHDLGGLNASAFYDPETQWGFANSPIIYEDTVILQTDIYGGAYLAAWNLETGKQVWRTEREVAPSFSTPAVLNGDSGDELVVNGSTIYGYNPNDGKELWRLGPNSEMVIAAPVVGEDVVYVSAGYPPVKPIYAIKAGTRGELSVDPGEDHDRLAWSHNRGGAYMPTPLLYRGYFFVVHYNSRFVVYNAKTGEPIHKARFSKAGTFTNSPVAVNGKLYIGTEEGLLYVLKAEPDFAELAVNDFAEPLMATPAVSEGILVVRTPDHLYAIAGKGKTAM